MPTETENPLHRLTPEQIEAIGKEFDALHEEVFDDLGDRDARYIRSMIELHRRLALLGRLLLVGSRYRPLWAAGTATLSLAKILENMEIGHNVMHGQWDWMNDPVINSAAWDWDSASTPEAWKHSHNYVHHTYTNIRGKDKDLGYEIMRIDPHQKWNPVYLGQPVYNVLLAMLFEWGVAFHDLDFDAVRSGEKSKEEVRRQLKGMAGKARSQIVKDYIAFPALSALLMAIPDARARKVEEGRWERAKRRALRRPEPKQRLLGPTFGATLTADVAANVIRNVWAYAIIFCGHFPDQTYTFSQRETDDETTRRALRPPAARRSEHRGRSALPRHQRQPRLPGRAPPLPGHAEHPLRRDRPARARDLRALRAALQHRPAAQAARDGAAHDPAARLPGREGAPEARALQGGEAQGLGGADGSDGRRALM